MRALRREVEDVLGSLDGGGRVTYDRSVRGRLHRIENDLAALLMMRKAGSVFASRGWRIVGGLAVLSAAVAPYVTPYLAH